MSLAAIKEAIQALSDHDKAILTQWLLELDRLQWDREIAEDFSPGGRGMDLVEEVDAEIARGRFKRLG